MDKIKYIKIEDENGNLSDNIPIGADAINVTMANGNSVEHEINNKVNESQLNNIQNQINGLASESPKIVSSISEMVEKSKIYILSTNMHIYTYNINTGSYIDSGFIYGADNSAINGSHIIQNENHWSNYNNDFDNLLPNKIYTIACSTAVMTNIKNKPYGGAISATMIAFNHSIDNLAGTSQILINNEGRVYIRIKWNRNGIQSYNDWTELANINILLELNQKIEDYNNYYDLYKSFQTVGCVGDSLASGQCVSNEDETIHHTDMYEYSWGQFMAKASGNTYYNFSKGGLTTRSWLSDSRGLSLALQSDKKCECYIIGLGVNDAGNLGIDYLGTSNDIDLSNFENNLDSFYGNYGKIIQNLKVIQPKAKFFLLTIPDNDATKILYNEAIRNISNLFENCYLIDLYEIRNEYLTGFIKNNQRWGHYNAVAYNRMSQIISRLISKYMYENYDEFKQIEFINNEHNYS